VQVVRQPADGFSVVEAWRIGRNAWTPPLFVGHLRRTARTLLNGSNSRRSTFEHAENIGR